MRHEARDIRHSELATLLYREYGLRNATMRFLPKGEDSYVYAVDHELEARQFLRLQQDNQPQGTERAYRALLELHRSGVAAALPPIPCRSGALTTRYRTYTVTLFPYVNGETLHRSPRSDAEIRRAARIIAEVHAQEPCPPYAKLPREGFENPFHGTIERCLQEATQPSGPAGSRTVEQTRRLLAVHAEEIAATSQMLSAIGAELRGYEADFCLTHGDPNYDNFLRDTDGVLYLTDWADIGWGPRERDLLAFTDDRFSLFLREYAGISGRLALDPDRMQYYHYRWTVQEIADFAERILLQDVDDTEASHAWDELAPYLPVPHEDIAESVARISEMAADTFGTA